MAKRRREKDEDEDLDFKIPKFDEEKFLRRERRNIKTMFLSFALGFIIAIICFGFWSLLEGSELRWGLIFLLGVVNASFLKYLFLRLNIDISDLGRKGWFGSYAVYFFTWLLVLIVLVNPPFYDDEDPRVEVVTLPNVQELGGTVKIIARITDNAGVENIDFSITYPDDTVYRPTDFTFEDNIFTYVHPSPDNLTVKDTYTYRINVTDVNGRSNNEKGGTGTFTYSNSAIVLTTPEDDSELRSYTPIEFKINSDVYDPVPFSIPGTDKIGYMDFRMYYTVNDGVEINVSRLNDENREDYRTTAEYEGWPRDSNVTLKAYVEVNHYFINVDQRFSNIIEDTDTHHFKTLDEADVGSGKRLIPPYPQFPLNHEKQPENIFNYYLPFYQVIQVPGFELMVFLISLIVVILIFKYRKKHRRN